MEEIDYRYICTNMTDFVMIVGIYFKNGRIQEMS